MDHGMVDEVVEGAEVEVEVVVKGAEAKAEVMWTPRSLSNFIGKFGTTIISTAISAWL